MLDCPEGTVPGWLDEQGLPTSCVGDLPCPGEEECERGEANPWTPEMGEAVPAPEPTVTMPVEPDIYPSALPLEPLPEAPPATEESVLHPPQVVERDELAMTGPDTLGWLVIAVLAVAVGAFVVLNERKKNRDKGGI